MVVYGIQFVVSVLSFSVGRIDCWYKTRPCSSLCPYPRGICMATGHHFATPGTMRFLFLSSHESTPTRAFISFGRRGNEYHKRSRAGPSCQHVQRCFQQLYQRWYTYIVANGDYSEGLDPGDPVVIILASVSEVRGFDPGRGRWIFSERKNPKYDFLRKGSKAAGPVS